MPKGMVIDMLRVFKKHIFNLIRFVTKNVTHLSLDVHSV